MYNFSQGCRAHPLFSLGLAGVALISTSLAVSASGPTAPIVEYVPPAPYTAPYIAPPVLNWNASYFGVQLGYACCGRDRVQLAPAPPGVIGTMHERGPFFGLHAGRTWQRGASVFGIEAALTFGQIGDSLSVGTASSRVRINPQIDLRGRIGRSTGDGLIYALGGIGAGRIAYQAGDTAVPSDIRSTFWTPGVSVGVGYEHLMGGGDWSVRGEYSYTIFRARDLTDGVQTTRATPDYHAIRLGLSRRF